MSGKFRRASMTQPLGHCLNEGLGEIVLSVKIPIICGRTERPRDLYCSLALGPDVVYIE